jgi:hypothetical protein
VLPDRPERPPRGESREVAALKELRVAQPDLAPAVDLQLELVEIQRRIQGRVPLPWIQADPQWLAAQQHAGRPAVRFGDIPLQWTDFRLAVRQIAGVLHRHETIEAADYQEILEVGRGGDLQSLVSTWYLDTSGVDEAPAHPPSARTMPGGFDQVLLLAIRPFLTRCVEALAHRDFSAWQHGRCPFCGWEPDFAVIASSGDRRLICGRCVAQWAFDPLACPFCANADRRRITSFATPDGRYRVYACDACRRYLKAYDARNAARPVMVALDSIATLPLDAAAMQRGYAG